VLEAERIEHDRAQGPHARPVGWMQESHR
jgi:hypothetical protein